MNKIFIVFKKELIEMIRDRRVFIGLIVLPGMIVYMMGTVMSTSVQNVSQSMEVIKIAVLDMDSSKESKRLVQFLKENKIDVKYVNTTVHDYDNLFREMSKEEINILVVIPADFEEKIRNCESANITTYLIFSSYDTTEIIRYERVRQSIKIYSDGIARQRIEESTGLNSSKVLNPIEINGKSVFNYVVKDVDPEYYFTLIYSHGLAIMMVAIIILSFSTQLAAISIGMEKEQKTLETILSMPIKRFHLLAGKAISIGFLSFVGTIIFFIVYMQMISSVSSSYRASHQLKDISYIFSISPYGLILFVIVTFLTLMLSISMAMLLSVFCEDVRGAQMLSSIIYIPSIISMLLCMFVDPASMQPPLRFLVFAIPFSYIVLASKSIYTANYSYAFIGIPYLLFLTILVIYVTAKFFETEKILTVRLFKRRNLRQ